MSLINKFNPLLKDNLQKIPDNTGSGNLFLSNDGTFKSPFVGSTYKGDVYIASDFPTLAEVQEGWYYSVKANVTDNDVLKTNTGTSWVIGQDIYWDGITWQDFGVLVNNSNPYVTFGTGGQYPTLRAAVLAGKYNLIQVGNSTETGDITILGTNTLNITSTSLNNILDLNTRFINSSGNSHLIFDKVYYRISNNAGFIPGNTMRIIFNNSILDCKSSISFQTVVLNNCTINLDNTLEFSVQGTNLNNCKFIGSSINASIRFANCEVNNIFLQGTFNSTSLLIDFGSSISNLQSTITTSLSKLGTTGSCNISNWNAPNITISGCIQRMNINNSIFKTITSTTGTISLNNSVLNTSTTLSIPVTITNSLTDSILVNSEKCNLSNNRIGDGTSNTRGITVNPGITKAQLIGNISEVAIIDNSGNVLEKFGNITY